GVPRFDRVLALGQQSAGVSSLLTGCGKAYVPFGPEAHLPRPSASRVSKDPGLREAGTDLQIQTPAIGVVARILGLLDPLCRQPVNCARQSLPPFPVKKRRSETTRLLVAKNYGQGIWASLPTFLPTHWGWIGQDRFGRLGIAAGVS